MHIIFALVLLAVLYFVIRCAKRWVTENTIVDEPWPQSPGTLLQTKEKLWTS